MTAVKNPPADDDSTQGAGAPVGDVSAEFAKWKDIAARAQADLQNAKMRMEKEGQEIRIFAVQALIERLLPTIDNFRRSFEHLPVELSGHDWVKGLRATEQKLMKDLEAVGLRRIDPLGQPVDPSRHDVLQTAPGQKDMVIEVYEAGYELGGRVLKAAKVVAGNGN